MIVDFPAPVHASSRQIQVDSRQPFGPMMTLRLGPTCTSTSVYVLRRQDEIVRSC